MDQEISFGDIPFTLRSVYLRGARVSMADDFDPLTPGIELEGSFRIASQFLRTREQDLREGEAEAIRICTYITTFEFRYLRNEADRDEEEDGPAYWLDISADIAADYRIKADLSQDNLEEWGARNVLLHSWPYWREFCHSTQLRMNVPASIMPMMAFGERKADLDRSHGDSQQPEGKKPE